MREDRNNSGRSPKNSIPRPKDKDRVKYVLVPLKKSASDTTTESRPQTSVLVQPRKLLFTPECRPGTPNPRLGRPPRPHSIRPPRPRPVPNASDSQVYSAHSQRSEIHLKPVDLPPNQSPSSDSEEEVEIVNDVRPLSRRQTVVQKPLQTHLPFQLPRISSNSRPVTRMASTNTLRTTASTQNLPSSCSCAGGWGDDKRDERFHKCPLCKTAKEAMAHQLQNMNSRYMTDLEWRICHAVNIYVFRNGEEGVSPVLIHIPPAWKRNMRTVMQLIEERVRFPGAYAKKLYKMDGTRVRHPCELEMYTNYVVAPSYDKYFKCAAYGRRKSPLLVLNKESKHVRVLRLANEGFDDWLLRKRACGDERPQFYFPDIVEMELPDQIVPQPDSKGKRKPGSSEPSPRSKGKGKGRDSREYGVNTCLVQETLRDPNELLAKSRYGPYGFPLNKDGLKPLEKSMSKTKVSFTLMKKGSGDKLGRDEDHNHSFHPGAKGECLERRSHGDVSFRSSTDAIAEDDWDEIPPEREVRKNGSSMTLIRPMTSSSLFPTPARSYTLMKDTKSRESNAREGGTQTTPPNNGWEGRETVLKESIRDISWDLSRRSSVSHTTSSTRDENNNSNYSMRKTRPSVPGHAYYPAQVGKRSSYEEFQSRREDPPHQRPERREEPRESRTPPEIHDPRDYPQYPFRIPEPYHNQRGDVPIQFQEHWPPRMYQNYEGDSSPREIQGAQWRRDMPLPIHLQHQSQQQPIPHPGLCNAGGGNVGYPGYPPYIQYPYTFLPYYPNSEGAYYPPFGQQPCQPPVPQYARNEGREVQAPQESSPNSPSMRDQPQPRSSGEAMRSKPKTILYKMRKKKYRPNVN